MLADAGVKNVAGELVLIINFILNGSVAQSVEQRTENPCVGGSIPSRATIYVFFLLLEG